MSSCLRYALKVLILSRFPDLDAIASNAMVLNLGATGGDSDIKGARKRRGARMLWGYSNTQYPIIQYKSILLTKMTESPDVSSRFA